MAQNQIQELSALTNQYAERFNSGIRPDVYDTTTREERSARMKEALATGRPVSEWHGPSTTLMRGPLTEAATQ